MSGNTGDISYLVLTGQGDPDHNDNPTSYTIENNTFADTQTTYLFQTPKRSYTPPTITVTNNWWGTTITTDIDSKIYDWNDDLDFRTVAYAHILTAP